MNAPADSGLPLYTRVAGELAQAIQAGSLRPGDRLPSVRMLCQQHGVSASTVTQAYRWLENQRLVEARPKSGYFVAARHAPLPEPELDTRMSRAGFVTPDDLTRQFLFGNDDPDAAPSFCPLPAREILPEAKLRQLTAKLNRLHPEYASRYSITGSLNLRQEIARRSVSAGVRLRPEEIILTNGGSEAVFLALRSAAQAGDTVALESPTYWMLLEIIRTLGMKSIEIPTHPREGISVEALDLATQRPGAVQACVVVPNFHNPLGSLMPLANKRRLVALARERGFTLIETDIYGETYFGDERPPVLKAFDTHDDVILCSAFTKTVAPGYRVGWIAPGRHFKTAQSHKFHTSITGAMLPQEVIAEFIRDGGYDHHMRKLRASLKQQCAQMVDAVTRLFPDGCRLSVPQGGLMLWIEMPRSVDSRKVFERARHEHIGCAPGATFSNSTRFNHFLRLHYGEPWSARHEAHIRRLGQIVAEEAERGRAAA
ncbi:PLP-dependent aminotransferase family protein [Piscinibacter gummiphilus]|uniref:PLP-dependent aminotransferase family protein n=1 Tax=Piscinibacter gummiphilus TaxID=946333 RepID=A0ABZ0CYS1_9BURK|nr:PLP-dependent aminotransferase family protein [Piscinibacter gummiphilus]WOB08190.1 PLP-dependent aminotransferase family protein [Piscinibacter gummiphilus]